MNKIILMGRLTKDPEIHGDGTGAVARYSLAVDRRFKNKDGEIETDFINIVAFGKSAEFAEKYFNKGMKVLITGRIQTGSYTNKDGQKVYTTDVVAEDQEFCESKGSSQTQEEEKPAKKTTKKAEKKVDPDDDFMNISEEEASELPW